MQARRAGEALSLFRSERAQGESDFQNQAIMSRILQSYVALHFPRYLPPNDSAFGSSSSGSDRNGDFGLGRDDTYDRQAGGVSRETGAPLLPLVRGPAGVLWWFAVLGMSAGASRWCGLASQSNIGGCTACCHNKVGSQARSPHFTVSQLAAAAACELPPVAAACCTQTVMMRTLDVCQGRKLALISRADAEAGFAAVRFVCERGRMHVVSVLMHTQAWATGYCLSSKRASRQPKRAPPPR
jgi:hypothetical protein